MRYKLGRLTCMAFSETELEISEGILTCGCGRWYPIIGGIPRLLPDSLMADFLLANTGFLQKYKHSIPEGHKGFRHQGLGRLSGGLQTVSGYIKSI